MEASWEKSLLGALDSARAGVFMIRGALGEPNLPGYQKENFDLGSLPAASPLEPILPWIVDAWKGKPQAERSSLLKKAGFYAPHRRLFMAWALDGRAENPDEMLFSDANQRYERQSWFSALARLFCLLCAGERRVFLLRRGQAISQGMIAFLLALQDCTIPAKVIVLLECDGPRAWAGPTHLDHWAAFIKQLDQRAALIRSRASMQTKGADQGAGPPKISPPPRLMEAYRLLFCAEDALAILDELGEDGVSDWDVLKLICCECWACIGDFGRAGLQIDAVISRLHEVTHIHRAQLLACRISGWKRNEEACLRALERAWEQARLIADPMPSIHCRIHEVFIQEMFGSKPDLIQLADRLSDELQVYKLDNVIGYLDTLVIHYDWIIKARGWESAMNKAQKTLARYKHLGNLYRQSILLHIHGYLFSLAGHNDKALEYFNAGIRLRKRLGDTIELIKLLNGTGYFCFSTAKLKEGLSLFDKALLLIESIGDHQETCLTLFNMAQVFFFTGCFEEAMLVLTSILDVMEILGYDNLPFHRKSKVLALTGLTAWHLGKESQALDYAQASTRVVIDSDAKAYVNLLQALLLEDAEGSVVIEAAFETCLSLTKDDGLSHLRLHILCVKALRLRNIKPQASAELFQKAALEARQRKMDLEASWIEEAASVGSRQPSRLKIKASTRVLINRLHSSALQEAMNLKLLNTLGQIQFLQRFQSIINVGITSEQIMEKSVLLITEQVHPIRVRIRDLRNPLAEDADFLVGVSLGEDTLRLEFDLRDSSRSAIEAEELHVLSLALAHLSLILDLKGAQEVLEEAARIDPLTGLLSRRELRERLQMEYNRCRRYSKESGQGFSVLFIDLDRFKSYNDNLGHGAGDIILQSFAKLLKDSFRSMDLIGRWGGDEFLVILPATTLPGTELAADRIISALKEAAGFCEELSAALGREITLPEERWLGCSIGISIYHPASEKSVDEIIAEADSKLYQAKEGGRGRAIY